MMYIFYGSLGVLLWKCGTQLLKVPRCWSQDDGAANTQDIKIMVINSRLSSCIVMIWQEAKYRSLDEEEEKKKKLQLSKMSKYKKVVY